MDTFIEASIKKRMEQNLPAVLLVKVYWTCRESSLFHSNTMPLSLTFLIFFSNVTEDRPLAELIFTTSASASPTDDK